MQLRLARPDDAREILRWRNDSITRFYRDDDREITPDEHTAWFCRRQLSENKIYVFAAHDCPIGNICFDVSDKGTELGWVVAPEQRGHGIGRRMLQEAFKITEGPIWCKAREDNTASIRLAAHCGFILDKIMGRMIHLRHNGSPHHQD